MRPDIPQRLPPVLTGLGASLLFGIAAGALSQEGALGAYVGLLFACLNWFERVVKIQTRARRKI